MREPSVSCQTTAKLMQADACARVNNVKQDSIETSKF